ncbi:MAG: hypothetical protein GY832_22430, partial [Chloroflexi bacterium]|nr:hypothetical protein [Chloroflexota bacterium]
AVAFYNDPEDKHYDVVSATHLVSHLDISGKLVAFEHVDIVPPGPLYHQPRLSGDWTIPIRKRGRVHVPRPVLDWLGVDTTEKANS